MCVCVIFVYVFICVLGCTDMGVNVRGVQKFDVG